MSINKGQTPTSGLAYPATGANQDAQTDLLQTISDNISSLIGTEVTADSLLQAIKDSLTSISTSGKQDDQTSLLTVIKDLLSKEATAAGQTSQSLILTAIATAVAAGATTSDIGQLIQALQAGFATINPNLKVTGYELTKPDALTANFDILNPDGGSAGVAGGIITLAPPSVNTKSLYLFSKGLYTLPLHSLFDVFTAGGSLFYPSTILEPFETGFVSVDPVTGLVDWNHYVSVSAIEYQTTTTLTLYETRVKVCNNGVLVQKDFLKQPALEKHGQNSENTNSENTFNRAMSQLQINHKGVYFDYGMPGMQTYDQRTDYLEQLPDESRNYKFFIRLTGGFQSLKFGHLRVFETGAPRIPAEIIAYNKVPVYFPEPPEVLIAAGSVGIYPVGAYLPVGFSSTPTVAIGGYVNTGLANASGQEVKGAMAAGVSVNYPAKDSQRSGLPGNQVKTNRWCIYADANATAQVQISDDGTTWRNDPDFNVTIVAGRINKIEVPVYWRYNRLNFNNGTAPQTTLNIQYSQICN